MNKKLSQTTKDKIRAKLLGNSNPLGHKHTQATKDKISASALGNSNSLGCKHSQATKDNMRASQLGKKASIATRLKQSKAHKGQIPWNKGQGKTTENQRIRISIEYRLWRESVFARDNWTCQKTGVRGGNLCSHHIKNFAQYPELRLAIDNGVTLSGKAHKAFHKKYGRRNNTKEQLEEFINIIN